MYQLSDLEKMILLLVELALIGGYIYLAIQFVKMIFRVKRIEKYLETNIPYIEKLLEDIRDSVK